MSEPNTLPYQVDEQIAKQTVPFQEVTPAPPPSFPRLEGYEILEELGHGGMGVVYKARQKGTEQVVALKMLHPMWGGRLEGDELGAPAPRDEAIEQFLLEVKAAARLRHPNRVRILHMGQHEGRPFYVMELIEGGSLADKARTPPGVTKEAAVNYLADVAEAVHEAHQNGILHRDLKPHNILIDVRTDEALLTDFGLAKMGRAAPADPGSITESGRHLSRVAGTLPYMSPEQTHDADQATEASDVYSLGATLYELLTGGPPFVAKSRAELVDRIREEEPAPPRANGRDVNPRIAAICLKCLQKDPAKRYPTALEFAQALRRYQVEVQYARHFTSMGTFLLGLGPVVLLINLAVFLLLRIHVFEPVIWLVMFSMYPALFSVFLLAPAKDTGLDYSLSRKEMWSIWGGKFFAAVAISAALRTAFAHDPERALVLVYPVFAALSGMAVFILVAKMERKLVLLAFGSWLTGVVMVFKLEWSPIFYGVYAMAGVLLYGMYLRKLGEDLK
jgi:predicted Ser/Thr protein kinase